MPAQRILLADDQPEVERAFRRAAAKHGFEVVSTGVGGDVPALVEQSQPDLIVLDLAFPDADGRDILARLKAEPRTRDTPVLVWSARNPESERAVALALGAEDYVEKIDADTLLFKIRRLLLRILNA